MTDQELAAWGKIAEPLDGQDMPKPSIVRLERWQLKQLIDEIRASR